MHFFVSENGFPGRETGFFFGKCISRPGNAFFCFRKWFSRSGNGLFFSESAFPGRELYFFVSENVISVWKSGFLFSEMRFPVGNRVSPFSGCGAGGRNRSRRRGLSSAGRRRGASTASGCRAAGRGGVVPLRHGPTRGAGRVGAVPAFRPRRSFPPGGSGRARSG